jgi:hypothetical protein
VSVLAKPAFVVTALSAPLFEPAHSIHDFFGDLLRPVVLGFLVPGLLGLPKLLGDLKLEMW